ncbi:MAG TPA: hypothetical protein VNJ03_00620 [Vicinamibacterales bacterium]|nr:hypothetical protein [Vicinamibacterales bacterium]
MLAVIGGACGALGGGGVGAGLFRAEAHAGSHRVVALIGGAALGGGLAGGAVQLLARWGLAALLGLDVDVGGGLEGLTIGGAAGAGYAIATRPPDGDMAGPRGERRLRPTLVIAVLCGLAGLALTLAGYPLVGGTIHAIADAAEGSRATLAPLGRLIGEPDSVRCRARSWRSAKRLHSASDSRPASCAVRRARRTPTSAAPEPLLPGLTGISPNAHAP